jgi:hypothetical protein
MFTAEYLSDGTTAFKNTVSGVRYIIANAGRDHALYREGQLVLTGPRSHCVDAIEREGRRYG